MDGSLPLMAQTYGCTAGQFLRFRFTVYRVGPGLIRHGCVARESEQVLANTADGSGSGTSCVQPLPASCQWLPSDERLPLCRISA